MSDIKNISDVMEELKRGSANPQLVQNWKALVPAGSKWFPGCIGLADCTVCKGTGFLRLDLPVGHKYFGKLMLCDCTKRSPVLLQLRAQKETPRDPDDKEYEDPRRKMPEYLR